LNRRDFGTSPIGECTFRKHSVIASSNCYSLTLDFTLRNNFLLEMPVVTRAAASKAEANK